MRARTSLRERDVEIPGIPESIPRARVAGLLEALGIDPKQMLSLRIEPFAIHVEVYALKDGNRYWDSGADKKGAAHMIAIPIVNGSVDEDRT